MMTGYNNGRYPRNSLYSDCIIEDKTVVLQKKDNEGFGFVLRGAKGECSGIPFHSVCVCVCMCVCCTQACMKNLPQLGNKHETSIFLGALGC